MLGVSPENLEISAVHDAVSAPEMIREMVLSHRDSGLDRAYAAVARFCGLTPRRVRGYWHNEITDPRTSEGRKILNGYEAWLGQETRRLDARRALLVARLDALRNTHEATHAEVRHLAREALDGCGELLDGSGHARP